jgi:hypothetical protein
MFDTIKNEDGTTTIRCAVTDREWVCPAGNGSARRETEATALQMQKSLIAKLGFDAEKPERVEVYRDAYATYQRKRGR